MAFQNNKETPPAQSDNHPPKPPRITITSPTNTNYRTLYRPRGIAPRMPTTTPAPVPLTANISIRKYIYYMPYPLPPRTPVPYSIHLPASNPLNLPTTLFEPTTTLVLTAPNATFVDLRFLKPTSPTEPEKQELEWGFAGRSSSIPYPAGQRGIGKWNATVSHASWTHWVDSKYLVGQDIPVDEGDMYPIDSMRTLEHGHAWDEGTKAWRSHEEMWEDEDVTSTTTTTGTTASSSTADASATAAAEGKKSCVVMRCQDDAKAFRGVIVRLGKYVQGILVEGNQVTAERWEWSSEGGWKRTQRVGKNFLPCMTLVQEGLAEGNKVNFGIFDWVIEGVWEL